MFIISAVFNIIEQVINDEQVMGEIHIIEQAVSAMKQQWGESGLNITYDLTPQSNPILKGRVNIIGIDFPCLVENEVNSINIGRIQDLIKGCT